MSDAHDAQEARPTDHPAGRARPAGGGGPPPRPATPSRPCRAPSPRTAPAATPGRAPRGSMTPTRRRSAPGPGGPTPPPPNRPARPARTPTPSPGRTPHQAIGEAVRERTAMTARVVDGHALARRIEGMALLGPTAVLEAMLHHVGPASDVHRGAVGGHGTGPPDGAGGRDPTSRPCAARTMGIRAGIVALPAVGDPLAAAGVGVPERRGGGTDPTGRAGPACIPAGPAWRPGGPARRRERPGRRPSPDRRTPRSGRGRTSAGAGNRARPDHMRTSRTPSRPSQGARPGAAANRSHAHAIGRNGLKRMKSSSASSGAPRSSISPRYSPPRGG